jgi:nitrite reductase/ring-hydroxylating ferredoxin subunit
MALRWRRDFPITAAEDSYVARREFTKCLGLTSLAFFIGTFAAAARKVAHQFFGQPNPPFMVSAIEDVPVGGYKLFRYPTENDPCILVRRAADRFVAFQQRCTHLSCPVYPDAATNQLVCPCHEGFFSIDDGRPLAGPPKRPLTMLSLSTRDAAVWVNSSDEVNV